MHTLTDQEVKRDPLAPFEDALRGQPTLVTAGGHAVMLALPVGAKGSMQKTLLDLAVQLYESQAVSLGRAAEIAGLSYADMLDELGSRGVATFKLQPGDLERELAAFGAGAQQRRPYLLAPGC
jgi:predicted HTH domain antitoxin